MSLRLSHGSMLSATSDARGFRQSVTIDFLTRETRGHVHQYTGMLRSDVTNDQCDPRDRGLVTATFCWRGMPRAESWAEAQLAITKEVTKVERVFNKTKDRRHRVAVQIPQLSHLSCVSCFDSKRQPGEAFVFQDKIRSKDFKVFTGVSKDKPLPIGSVRQLLRWARSVNSGKPKAAKQHKIVQAFEHHFLIFHQGQKAVDELRGVYDEDEGYTLTLPVIHSTDRHYGPTDLGDKGISQVIARHVCNEFCKHLPSMAAMCRYAKTQTQKED